ncbi:MAG: hypothetical protein IPK27_11060, partial [Rhodanobacteraceae bacterium]|nr:hypothetical protein [Rhodanobacteraceae bacterium]
MEAIARNGSTSVGLEVFDSTPAANTVNDVTIRDSTIVAVGSSGTRALAASLGKVRDSRILGSRFLAVESTLSSVAARLTNTSTLIRDSQFQAFSPGQTGEAVGLAIDSTQGGFLETRNIQVDATGAAVATGVSLESEALPTAGRVNFNGPLIVVGGAPELRGIYSRGMAFDIRQGSVFVNGGAA